MISLSYILLNKTIRNRIDFFFIFELQNQSPTITISKILFNYNLRSNFIVLTMFNTINININTIMIKIPIVFENFEVRYIQKFGISPCYMK